MVSRVLFFLFVAFFWSTSTSASKADLQALLTKSQTLNLSEHITWKKLLSYQADSKSPSGYTSDIHTTSFFASPAGKTNPQEEFRATLEAFFKPTPENENDHAQCKFRGRYVWLNKMLNFNSASIPQINCADYLKWSLNGNTQSISLLLATGYLNNPASFYGHTLIKLNTKPGHKKNALEDVTVNYGAIVPESDGMIPYILKGLFGGYKAGFTHNQYYFHTHNYGELEQRDVWEYELNLSIDEVNLFLGHIWELLGKKYTYYFLAKNCAYQMAKELEIIEGINIVPKNPVWVIPQTIIKNLNEATLNGAPLVKKIRHLPSRQSRLYSRYSNLNAKEKQIVKRAVNNIETLNKDTFNLLDTTTKHRTLDTLLDYYQFVRDKEKLDEDKNNILYKKVLTKRYQSPPGGYEKISDLSQAPHHGRRPSMTTVGIFNNEERNSGIHLKLRPAYYDTLDAGIGHIPNAALTMGEVQLSVTDDSTYLHHIDFVKVESVNNRITNLPADARHAWRLQASVEQFSLECTDCLTPIFTGDMGHTKNIFDNRLFVGAFIGGGIQESHKNSGAYFLRPTLQLNIHAFEKLKIGAQAEYRKYSDERSGSRQIANINARFELTNNSDIRLYLQKNITRESGLSFSWYW